MVENHVHHQLDSSGVAVVGQLAVFVVGAETGVNAVVVGGGVAMIGAVAAAVGRVVLQHGSEPQGCDAQLGKVVEVLAQTFDVASVAQARLFAVDGVVGHAGLLVVFGFAVGETVGHEHVEHVAGIKSLAGTAFHAAGAKFVTDRLFLLPLGEGQLQRARMCLFIDIQVDKQVVG